MQLGRIDWKQIRLRAAEGLGRLDIEVDVTQPLNSYSLAVQQMVAIARALDIEAKVLVLDEPTSSLDANEVGHLFSVLRKLKTQGLGIVFVSHFLDQIYAIADRLTVLRNGKLIGEYEAAKLPRLELIAKMIGKDLKAAGEMSARRRPEPLQAVRENIVLALQASKGWARRISARRQAELAGNYIKALNIATSDAEKPMKFLSGGNQQKAVLARWLASQPRLLILDEPTRGIDIGAKAEIEKLIAKLCAEGMAILFISSELEEVVRDSHRVVVLRDRKKVCELTGEQIELSAIMKAIAGTPHEE